MTRRRYPPGRAKITAAQQFLEMSRPLQNRSLDSIGKRRDASEDDIVAALEKVGAKVWHMHQPCDLVVKFGSIHDWLLRGHTRGLYKLHPMYYFLDCDRASKGKRDAAQLRLFEEWGVVIVKTAEDALRAIGAM